VSGSPLLYVDPKGQELILAGIGAGVGALWGGINGYLSGDMGGALALDIAAGAGTGALAGLTNGVSLLEVAGGVATRAIISAGIESYRQMGIAALDPCKGTSGKNIALAAGFSVFGDAAGAIAGMVRTPASWMPIVNEQRGAFWGGNGAGVAGSPFSILDRMNERNSDCSCK
jgi:hypothetical protein